MTRDDGPVTVAPDSDGEDERDTEDDSKGEEPDASPDAGLDPDVVRSVEAFRSLQRQIAGIDLSVVRAAQRAIASSLSSVNVPAIVAAQDAIARNIARSIDFSGLQAAANKALIAAATSPASPRHSSDGHGLSHRRSICLRCIRRTRLSFKRSPWGRQGSASLVG